MIEKRGKSGVDGLLQEKADQRRTLPKGQSHARRRPQIPTGWCRWQPQRARHLILIEAREERIKQGKLGAIGW